MEETVELAVVAEDSSSVSEAPAELAALGGTWLVTAQTAPSDSCLWVMCRSVNFFTSSLFLVEFNVGKFSHSGTCDIWPVCVSWLSGSWEELNAMKCNLPPVLIGILSSHPSPDPSIDPL